MMICWMIDGHVSRTPINAELARPVLRNMRRAYPGVLFWLYDPGDGMKWRS